MSHKNVTGNTASQADLDASRGFRTPLQPLFGALVVERVHHRSPLWADGGLSAHPAAPATGKETATA